MSLKYTLGLDIGIASVGWAILDIERAKIIRLGVRAFEKAENAKDGTSPAADRRAARGMRRRIQRRSKRMHNIRALFVTRGLMPSLEAIEAFFSMPHEKTPYILRAEGLDRLLSSGEWARVLLHIAKHRGFKSNRKNEPTESDKVDESQKILAGIESNKKILNEGAYRTIGEMMALDPKFAEHKRNKGGDYSNTVGRDFLQREAELLFEAQRSFGNSYADGCFERDYLSLFLHQRPFASGDQIVKMVGQCTLEPEEKRAPKMSWTAERFMLLGKILNQRIRTRSGERGFDEAERDIVIGLAYKNAKVTYKQIRKALEMPDGHSFVGLRYKLNETREQSEGKAFAELKGTHRLAKKLGMSTMEVSAGASEYFDTIAFALTAYKTDRDVSAHLKENTSLDDAAIGALLDLSFDKFGMLSIKALRKIIPFMEDGLRYDQACVCAGYTHSQGGGFGEPQLLLPLPGDDIRNPVVARSLHQVRKVVNAIIRRYGSPTYVHIELARDLHKSFDERRQIEREQEENRKDRERARRELEGTFGLNDPRGGDILKLRLYREQNGMCAYSGRPFDAGRVMSDMKYAEIDHILPYSRSFDDSYSNKALVLSDENQNKRNQTPYEYFGSNTERWNKYEAWVHANIRSLRKKQNLLRLSLTEEDAAGMTERNLNDTRYITRYAAAWIGGSLVFADESIKLPVLTVNGRATSILRGRWGVADLKDREKNDLHHALDAAVVAATSRSIVKRISDYSAARELHRLQKQSTDGKRERFPLPWLSFRKELVVLLSPEPVQAAADEALIGFGNYTEDEIAALRPVFVSRMPNRRAKGAAHQETIRSIRDGVTAIKTSLTSLTLGKLETMLGKDRDRALYDALKKRLESFDGNAKKAFAEPFYKPTKDGGRGPLVRSVKLTSVDRSGIEIRGGRAANGIMVRVDVYSKGGKFYLVPHYVDDVARGVVKNRAIVAHKSEDEWQLINDSFDFEFSLFYNDLVRVRAKVGEILAYYKGTNRSAASITVLLHDGSQEIEGIGVKTCGLFEKYQVDPLGDYVKVGREPPPAGKRSWAGGSSS